MLYQTPNEAMDDISRRAQEGEISQEDAMDVIRSIDEATDYWQEALDVPKEARPLEDGRAMKEHAVGRALVAGEVDIYDAYDAVGIY